MSTYLGVTVFRYLGKTEREKSVKKATAENYKLSISFSHGGYPDRCKSLSLSVFLSVCLSPLGWKQCHQSVRLKSIDEAQSCNVTLPGYTCDFDRDSLKVGDKRPQPNKAPVFLAAEWHSDVLAVLQGEQVAQLSLHRLQSLVDALPRLPVSR